MALNRNGSPEGSISKKIVTTKGDLITATANAIPSRLAAGSDGDTLVADSAATTGLRYSPMPISQPVINGGMDIWQRGTSFALAASTSTYTADRFKCRRNATGSTFSRQTTSDTTNLPFIQYCMRVQRDSGNTATDLIQLTQSIESVNSIPYAGKTVTLSFYARKGANMSGDLFVNFKASTLTDADIIVNTFATSMASTSQALTTTWTRYSFTGTVGASDVTLGFQLYYTPSGTAGAADYFEVTGIQIDAGSVALPFRRAGGTIQGELAACQRYFIGLSSTENVYTNFAVGVYGTTTVAQVMVPLPVTMRVKPSISVGTVGNYTVDGVAANVCSNLVAGQLGNQMIGLSATTGASTTGYGCYLRASNTTSALIQISAEL